MLPPVVVELRAKAGELRTELAGVRNDISKLANDGTSKGRQLAAGLASAGKAIAVGLGGSLLVVGTASVHMADTFELSHARLVTAIHNAGLSFDAFKPQIAAVDSQMEHYGFTNAQTETALADLTTATKNPTVAMRDLGLAANIAAARHMDLEKAAILVGKVQQGNTTVLKRFGIDLGIAAGGATKLVAAQKSLTTAEVAYQGVLEKIHAGKLKGAAADAALQAAHLRLTQAQKNLNDAQQAGTRGIDALTARFKGQAAAAADTFAGKQAVLKAQIEDLGTKLGMWLIPKIEALIAITIKVVDWLEKHKAIAAALAIVIGGVMVAAMGAWAVSMFTAGGALAFLISPVTLVVAAVAAVAAGVIYAYTHFKWFHDTVDAVGRFLRDVFWPIVKQVFEAIYTVVRVEIIAMIDYFKLWWIGLQWAWQNIGRPLFDAIRAIIGTFVSDIEHVWNFLTPVFRALWAGVSAVWRADGVPIFNAIKYVIDDMVGAFQAIEGPITSVFSGISDGIHSAMRAAVHVFFLGVNAFLSIAKSMADAYNSIPGVPHIQGIHTISEPSFHEGGLYRAPPGKREGIAVLRDGEIVLTPEQQQRRASKPTSDQHINVYAQTNADPFEIARQVAWIVRTA